MTKKLSLLLASALILTACSATPKTSTDSSVTQNSSTQDSNPSPTPQPQTSAQSLKDIIALGKDQKCTWSLNENGQNMSGEMLISGKKFKQTIKTTNDQAGGITTNVVSDGLYIYTWNSQMPDTGFKMKFDESAMENPQAAASQPVNLEKKFDFNCTPATVNATELQAPGNVRFVDFTDTVKQLQKQMPNLDALDKIKP
jgi:hypothetical protein